MTISKEAITEAITAAIATPGEPVYVSESVVVIVNTDATISVLDNGEEILCRSRSDAERIIAENLGIDYTETNTETVSMPPELKRRLIDFCIVNDTTASRFIYELLERELPA